MAEGKQGKRIGFMGGTFDPVHYGHLVLAEQVRAQYNLDKIVFIPSGIPPHKKNSDVSSNMHRYFMSVLATITNPNFAVSKIEIENEEVSYTVNTLKSINEKYNSDEYEQFFITGADALLNIESWKDVDVLLRNCHFIAGTRPGHATVEIQEKIAELEGKYGAHITLIKVPALAISSTDIRRRVKEKLSIKYLLPESVELYIYKNNLYR